MSEPARPLTICEIDTELVKRYQEFRFSRKKNAEVIIMKILHEKMVVVLDEILEDVTPEEIVSELPAAQPRYLLYRFPLQHDDGRTSYPLCFIFITPMGCKPELHMMYAGSKLDLINKLGSTKTFEVRNPEDFTTEWLSEKLRIV